jgi:hypothetical protein
MQTLRLLVAAMLLTVSTQTLANCITQTYLIDGRLMICTTCCYYGNCTTTCI